MEFTKTSEIAFGTARITISGFINEQADFGGYRLQDINEMHFDFELVELINSVGVKIWINWFTAALKQKSTLEIYFTKMPKVLVDQMNQVKDFLPPRAIVKSFYAPYFCEACDASQSKLLSKDIDYKLNSVTNLMEVIVPQITCVECKQEMSPDYIPQKYFHFLEHLRPTARLT